MAPSDRTSARRHGAKRSAAKERFWRGHVARQRRSNDSVRAYCREHELSEPSFYAWRAELTRRDGRVGHAERREASTSRSRSQSRVTRRPATFLPVTVDGWAMPAIELQLKSGLLIRVPVSDPAALRAVLEAVEARAC